MNYWELPTAKASPPTTPSLPAPPRAKTKKKAATHSTRTRITKALLTTNVGNVQNTTEVGTRRRQAARNRQALTDIFSHVDEDALVYLLQSPQGLKLRAAVLSYDETTVLTQLATNTKSLLSSCGKSSYAHIAYTLTRKLPSEFCNT